MPKVAILVTLESQNRLSHLIWNRCRRCRELYTYLCWEPRHGIQKICCYWLFALSVNFILLQITESKKTNVRNVLLSDLQSSTTYKWICSQTMSQHESISSKFGEPVDHSAIKSDVRDCFPSLFIIIIRRPTWIAEEFYQTCVASTACVRTLNKEQTIKEW